MEIRLYSSQDGVTKLGPGVRYVIWTQGCVRNCPGCMTPESQPLDQGTLQSVETVAKRIIQSGRNGITISGGEPFLQAEALCELISMIRKERDIGVIIYTGYTIEEIRAVNNVFFQKLLGMCDLIIDGAYIEELNDGKNLRGSSNQRAIALTDRYKEDANEYGTRPAEVEFFFKEDKISMVGVPSHDMLERIKKNTAKEEDGK